MSTRDWKDFAHALYPFNDHKAGSIATAIGKIRPQFRGATYFDLGQTVAARREIYALAAAFADTGDSTKNDEIRRLVKDNVSPHLKLLLYDMEINHGVPIAESKRIWTGYFDEAVRVYGHVQNIVRRRLKKTPGAFTVFSRQFMEELGTMIYLHFVMSYSGSPTDQLCAFKMGEFNFIKQFYNNTGCNCLCGTGFLASVAEKLGFEHVQARTIPGHIFITMVDEDIDSSHVVLELETTSRTVQEVIRSNVGGADIALLVDDLLKFSDHDSLPEVELTNRYAYFMLTSVDAMKEKFEVAVGAQSLILCRSYLKNLLRQNDNSFAFFKILSNSVNDRMFFWHLKLSDFSWRGDASLRSEAKALLSESLRVNQLDPAYAGLLWTASLLVGYERSIRVARIKRTSEYSPEPRPLPSREMIAALDSFMSAADTYPGDARPVYDTDLV